MQRERIKRRSLKTRRSAILEALEKTGVVKVVELSENLNTSSVTIRKDLEHMEQEGLLVRMHGGAKRIPNATVNHFNDSRKEEKKKIALAGANLIQDGDFIFINTGSTCYYLCESLRDKSNITVVTNSVSILNLLITFPNITTFFLGGKVNSDLQITVGDDATEQLAKYTANKLFIGMDGVDIEMGATTYNHVEDSIMRQMMVRAKQKILVVDDSKIGKVTFAKFANLADFDILVTNYSPKNNVILEKIRDMGVNVICTD